MRVAIVGAGALGSVYGGHLARSGCEVDVVGRSPRPSAPRRLERVGEEDGFDWQPGPALARTPETTDVIVVAVRYEALGEVPERIAGGTAPVVVLTPMMPDDHAHLSAALPGRVVAAMPSAVAYRNDAGVVRYWLPRGVSTLIECRTAPGAEAQLAARLQEAGIATKLERDVLSRNVATTLSFIPLAMAVDAAGGIDALLHDRDLLALALRAAGEGHALGRSVAKPEPWASLLLRFVTPWTLKAAVGLARSRAPEAVAYVEAHFGRKLQAQNVAMGERIVQLARESRAGGARADALEQLVTKLKNRRNG